ncbi:hypothetical protein PAE0065 [Pyrobaculum aerophilum str. IM2]|uniref:Uncharacterized protein n=1 Tax=Pyrobaculum aerophilum (strain ATCC 51768 / DSM 7523 / JCM 9630 / CIP 104966 / NBRC 100827 / IM2) TaxID=178306 RepID=Q8ZZV2_PYRAE|nr:hypothetical protein PAE0065 [Pyrobaculum aerophilum str. IM2]
MVPSSATTSLYLFLGANCLDQKLHGRLTHGVFNNVEKVRSWKLPHPL